MDDEGVDNFNVRLEQIQYEAEASRNRNEMRKQRAIAAAAENDAPSSPQPEGKVAWNGWVKPEGWTPPGWNEEKSMQAAKAFMGFKANPK